MIAALSSKTAVLPHQKSRTPGENDNHLILFSKIVLPCIKRIKHFHID